MLKMLKELQAEHSSLFYQINIFSFSSSLRHLEEQMTPKMTISHNLQLVFSGISAGLCDIQVSHSDTEKIHQPHLSPRAQKKAQPFHNPLASLPLASLCCHSFLGALHSPLQHLQAPKWQAPLPDQPSSPFPRSTPSSQAEQGKLPGGRYK